MILGMGGAMVDFVWIYKDTKNFLRVNALPFRKICVPLQSVWPEGNEADRADHEKLN